MKTHPLPEYELVDVASKHGARGEHTGVSGRHDGSRHGSKTEERDKVRSQVLQHHGQDHAGLLNGQWVRPLVGCLIPCCNRVSKNYEAVKSKRINTSYQFKDQDMLNLFIFYHKIPYPLAIPKMILTTTNVSTVLGSQVTDISRKKTWNLKTHHSSVYWKVFNGFEAKIYLA